MKLPRAVSLNRTAAFALIAFTAFVLPIGLANDELASESRLQKLAKALALIGCMAFTVMNSGALLKIAGKVLPALHLLFMAIIAASALYAPDPRYVIYSAFGYFGIWGLCTYLADRESGQQMFTVLLWTLVTFVIFSLAMLAIAGERAGTMAWTPSGGAWRFVGLCGRPVNMATVAAIMAGLAFIDQNTLKRNTKIGIIILGLATIYLTKSRTPLVAVAASIGVIYLVRNSAKFGFYSALMAIGGAILVGMVNVGDIAGQYLTRTGRAEELTTLTSRTEIWSFVLDEWNKSPLLGFGYGSTKTLLLNQFYLWDFTTESAHNLFLQCLFTLGLVGATVLFLILLLQARQISTARSRPGIFLTAYVYFMGITESSFAGPGIGLVTLCWLLGGSLLQADSKPETFVDIDSDPPGSGTGAEGMA